MQTLASKVWSKHVSAQRPFGLERRKVAEIIYVEAIVLVYALLRVKPVRRQTRIFISILTDLIFKRPNLIFELTHLVIGLFLPILLLRNNFLKVDDFNVLQFYFQIRLKWLHVVHKAEERRNVFGQE